MNRYDRLVFVYKPYVLSAVKYYKQHKLRSFLSMLGILCGVTSVFVLACIGEGAKRKALDQIGKLGIENVIVRGGQLTSMQRDKAVEKLSRGLRCEDAVAIKKNVAQVEEVACLKDVSASLIGVLKEMTPVIVAATPSYRDIQNLRMREGRFIAPQDLANNNLVAVIGHDVARNLGKKGLIGGYLRVEDSEFKIIGILNEYSWSTEESSPISARNYNQMIFIPLHSQSAIGDGGDVKKRMSDDSISEFILKIKSAKAVVVTVPLIKRMMEVLHSGVDDYSIVIPHELFQQVKQARGTFNFVLGSIASISLIVGGIGIMNIMLATVAERKKEIGIRRAVGASRLHIMRQFMVETVLLAFIGGLLGLLIGVLLAWIISLISRWEVVIVPWAAFLALFMAISVGIVSGLYPARQASFVNPIDALRNE